MRIKRGDDVDLNITVKDPKTGVAIDITGATIWFTVKRIGDTAAGDTSALISKKVTSHTQPTL